MLVRGGGQTTPRLFLHNLPAPFHRGVAAERSLPPLTRQSGWTCCIAADAGWLPWGGLCGSGVSSLESGARSGRGGLVEWSQWPTGSLPHGGFDCSPPAAGRQMPQKGGICLSVLLMG